MTEREPQMHDLRAQAAMLRSQTSAQLAGLQRAMLTAQQDPALRARLAAAAAQVAGVDHRLTQAIDAPVFTLQAGDLLALEQTVSSGEIATVIGEATAAQTTAAGSAVLTARVAAASLGTRQEVQTLSHDLFERRIFDSYLRFSSPADEAAFRQREAESQRYIQAQLAEKTPEGDLNAAGGEQGYMLDAHAHGAGDSPDFLPKWNALAEKTHRQRAAMRAAGQSTAEYDRHMQAAARQFLRKEGRSDAEIDRILAGQADPLDAVKASLEHHAHGHDHIASGADRRPDPAPLGAEALPEVTASPGAAIPETPAPLPLGAMTAKLKAAGVRLTDTGDAAPAHGVTAPKPAGTPGLVPGS